jgi:hypothetical protein
MKTYYIQECDKLSKIKKLFNIIKNENEKLIVPIDSNEISQKKAQRIVKKIYKQMQKTDTRHIALSKELQANNALMQVLENKDIDIFNGRWLWNYLVVETIDYVVKMINKNKNETEISIAVNLPTKSHLRNIEKIAKEFKKINIVTNHVNEFKAIANRIYVEYGIMITVSNNKKKSLAKSDIILNIDFPIELLNQFNIYENAVIVNLEGDMKILKKRFNGYVINNYEIESKRAEEFYEPEKLQKFCLKDLVEAEFYRKDTYEKIRKDLNLRALRIKHLVTLHGITKIEMN